MTSTGTKISIQGEAGCRPPRLQLGLSSLQPTLAPSCQPSLCSECCPFPGRLMVTIRTQSLSSAMRLSSIPVTADLVSVLLSSCLSIPRSFEFQVNCNVCRGWSRSFPSCLARPRFALLSGILTCLGTFAYVLPSVEFHRQHWT